MANGNPSMNSSLFPMVNKLAPRMASCSAQEKRAKIKEIAKMPRLQSLDLLCLNDDAIALIADQETINRRVQRVSVSHRNILPLCSFKNVQFLDLHIMDEDVTATDGQMQASAQSLRNLKGLTLIDCPSPFGAQLLPAIGNQLEYLALNYFYEADLGNSKFRKSMDSFPRFFKICTSRN